MNPLLTLANTVNEIKASGLGEPYSTSDYVVAGTVIQWGGNPVTMGNASPRDEHVQEAINAMAASGRFSRVEASSTGFLNPYWSLTLVSSIDRAHLEDVLRDIEGYFYQVGIVANTKAFWIASVPASAANNPNVAQTGTGGSVNPGPQTSSGGSLSLPSLPSIFGSGAANNSSSNPIDTLAQWLGVTPTQAAIVGAGAALLAVIAIGKVVK